MIRTCFDRENAQATITFNDFANSDEILDILESNPYISHWTIKNCTASRVNPEPHLHFDMEERTWEAYVALKTIGVRYLSNGPIVGYHTIAGMVAIVCDGLATHRLAVLADLCHQRDFDE